MIRKIRVFPIIVFLLLLPASFAPWSAWSSALSQVSEPSRVEMEPAGKDTVSLETRKKLLAAREAALLARSKAALADSWQLRAVNRVNRDLGREGTRKRLTTVRDGHKVTETRENLAGI
jgi:hypothetical protein